MVNWKSPEEAEAWWTEFQELKKKVDSFEKRMVAIARSVYKSFMFTMVVGAPAGGRKYIKSRALQYEKRLDDCKDENEMAKILNEFIEERNTYLKSGG